MNKITRFCQVLALVFLAWQTSPSVQANEILEEGPNYFVVQHDTGSFIGSVVMRMDISTDSLGKIHVTSRIVSITGKPGWTWVIGKSGGTDNAVEIKFSKGAQRLAFKAHYAPGKTVIDSGVVK